MMSFAIEYLARIDLYSTRAANPNEQTAFKNSRRYLNSRFPRRCVVVFVCT